MVHKSDHAALLDIEFGPYMLTEEFGFNFESIREPIDFKHDQLFYEDASVSSLDEPISHSNAAHD